VAYKSMKVPARVPFSAADERRERKETSRWALCTAVSRDWSFAYSAGAKVAGRARLEARGISFIHRKKELVLGRM
jgi:hypothetical protein